MYTTKFGDYNAVMGSIIMTEKDTLEVLLSNEFGQNVPKKFQNITPEEWAKYAFENDKEYVVTYIRTMIKLNLKINQVSFSDCKIADMKLDIENKTFKIDVEDLYVIDKKDYVENVRFIGSNWDNLFILSYNSQNRQTIEIKQIEKMEEIAEIKVKNNQIVFCGFGAQSGNWIELIFNNLSYAFMKM